MTTDLFSCGMLQKCNSMVWYGWEYYNAGGMWCGRLQTICFKTSIFFTSVKTYVSVQSSSAERFDGDLCLLCVEHLYTVGVVVKWNKGVS